MASADLPLSLAANPVLGHWIRIRSDGIVEVRSGKVELGQGVLTALAQIAAEELDVNVTRVQMIAAATDLSPDEGFTAGSLSIQNSGAALRQVCAEARALYLAVAAAKLAATTDELEVADGQINGPDDSATSYWELADDSLLNRPATGDAHIQGRVGLPGRRHQRCPAGPTRQTDRATALPARPRPGWAGVRADRSPALAWREAARRRYRTDQSAARCDHRRA